jgi:hypothetical protein
MVVVVVVVVKMVVIKVEVDSGQYGSRWRERCGRRPDKGTGMEMNVESSHAPTNGDRERWLIQLMQVIQMNPCKASSL